MCGIGGLIASNGVRVSASTAQMFARVLAHRGPDDHGFLSLADGKVRTGRDRSEFDDNAEVLLVHRRLSILDLSPTGWQPMATPDGRYWIVYNGEVYNYLELRTELEQLGHRFRSTSDTEVLLAAYSEWGSEALSRFVGMFAFAILDTLERRLVLARDFFGIKPLYYCRFKDGFAFASEIKPLLQLAGVGRLTDPEPLYLYLRHGVTDPDERTLFSSIKQLRPAHLMEIRLDKLETPTTHRFWQVPLQTRNDLSFEAAAKKLRELFVESVSLHLRSDVPVGAALSGGIDSSAVVMATREIIGERLDLQAFSYVASDPKISEGKWIELIARESKATLHQVRLEPLELVADLPALVAAQDQPFTSTSIYAQYRVFRLGAKAGIKVMLDGQGADELLAGYRPFLAARLTSLIHRANLGKAARLFSSASRLPGVGAAYLAQATIEHLLSQRVQNSVRSLVGKELLPRWLDRRWFQEHEIYGISIARVGGRDALRASLLEALTRTNLPALLRYEDRNSMAFSIESRVPFLTPKLATFILSLPESYIVSDRGESKFVFRAAMRGIVPNAVLDRSDKIGFATPEREWLTKLAPWADVVLSDGTAVAPLNLKLLRRDLDRVRLGTKPFPPGLWRSLNLIAWAKATGATF